MLLLGTGVEKDESKAIQYLLKAAEKNHANAMYALGCLYIDGGESFEKNVEEGLKWLRKIPNGDENDSMRDYMLARWGTNEDRAQVAENSRSRLVLDDRHEEVIFAYNYFRGKSQDIENHTIPEDLPLLKNIMEQYAEKESLKAKFFLGCYYLYIAKDRGFKTAKNYFQEIRYQEQTGFTEVMINITDEYERECDEFLRKPQFWASPDLFPGSVLK